MSASTYYNFVSAGEAAGGAQGKRPLLAGTKQLVGHLEQSRQTAVSPDSFVTSSSDSSLSLNSQFNLFTPNSTMSNFASHSTNSTFSSNSSSSSTSTSSRKTALNNIAHPSPSVITSPPQQLSATTKSPSLHMPSQMIHSYTLNSLEPRPLKPFKSRSAYIDAMKEDLAEWLNSIYSDLDLSPDNFFSQLETGAIICRHANNVTQMGRNLMMEQASVSSDGGSSSDNENGSSLNRDLSLTSHQNSLSSPSPENDETRLADQTRRNRFDNTKNCATRSISQFIHRHRNSATNSSTSSISTSNSSSGVGGGSRQRLSLTGPITSSMCSSRAMSERGIDWFRIKVIPYKSDAKPGTFFARDNICQFILWCRSLKILDCLLFETDDLVSRKNEKSFILCLLEVARIGFKVGMPTPLIIQLEQEIDREIENDAQLQKQLEFNHATGGRNGQQHIDDHLVDFLNDSDHFGASNDSENNSDDGLALQKQQSAEVNNNEDEGQRETQADANEQQSTDATEAHDDGEGAEFSEDFGPKPQLILNDLMNLHERMCGILALLLNGSSDDDIGDLERLLDRIDSRGPDYSSQLIEHKIPNGPSFKFKSSILHLRGETMQIQPLMDLNGNVLLINGQIYKYSGMAIDKFQSDTDFLSGLLALCQSPQQIAEIFAEIDGPFAIIFWHHRLRKLFYGRDVFGRKSLCILRSNENQPLIISSVADVTLERSDRKWTEVTCDGIHYIDLITEESPAEIILPWDLDPIYMKSDKCENRSSSIIGGPRLVLPWLKPLNLDTTDFSGFDENVRQSALDEFETKFLEAMQIRYKSNRKDCLSCRIDPKYSAITKEIICRESKVAVAFSGGIDSTMIAMALDRIMDIKETIDLVTVAFKDEAPDRGAVGSAFRELRKLCHKRTWRLVICDVDLSELQAERENVIRDLILPCETIFDDSLGCASWFVGRAKGRAIDSKLDDYWMSDHFESFLKYNPCNHDLNRQVTSNYKSPASMLFVGSSIDEQLGGYSSHKKAWVEAGTLGLCKEISHLMRRISWRNLGRDDRVYCHHGRDLKVPFLDSEFVSYLNELPIGIKMNLGESPDMGPKKILRELALRWGLNEAGRRVKRAMQFGTRIANLEKTKEKANDVCSRLRPRPAPSGQQVPILIDLTGD